MSNEFYGNQQQTETGSPAQAHAEAIRLRGYSIVHGVIEPEALKAWRARIDGIYAEQEKEFGASALEAIQERDVARAPLLYDRSFIDLAMQPLVLDVVQHLLGEWAILSLQNAVINRPGVKHHQSSWHRDLPHARFTSSHPVGINALFAIDDFSAETGGTQILPFTHQSLSLPSDGFIAENAMTATMTAGSVILFDAMIFHRAGANAAKAERRAVNHLYTLSMIKQQYDFPAALGDAAQFDAPTQRLLGYPSAVPRDDRAWRSARAARLNQAAA